MGDIRQIIRQRFIIHWLRIRGYLGFLSFMTGDPIFKPKIEQRVNYRREYSRGHNEARDTWYENMATTPAVTAVVPHSRPK